MCDNRDQVDDQANEDQLEQDRKAAEREAAREERQVISGINVAVTHQHNEPRT
jgi:hypothetical protein